MPLCTCLHGYMLLHFCNPLSSPVECLIIVYVQLSIDLTSLDTETSNIYTSDSIRPPRHYYTVKDIRNQKMNSTDAEQEWILKPDLPPWVSFPQIFICDIRVAWWYVCRFIKKINHEANELFWQQKLLLLHLY